jgi:hypothetical protein
MAHAPVANHWWHTTLYVCPRGLTTSFVPFGRGGFEIVLDLVGHEARISNTSGAVRVLALEPMPVATFFTELMGALDSMGIATRISARPNEVDPAIPFADDHEHAAYDPVATRTYFDQLLNVHRVMGEFRSHFSGKASPVHYSWGAMDLSCTRFSGRAAPEHPGGVPNCPDWVMVEGYSRELSSCGFWPGGGDEGAFYSYAYPEPPGFRDRPVAPRHATYDPHLAEFVLPYEDVRRAPDPGAALLEFFCSTYTAAADLGGWDREVLEDDTRRLHRSARSPGAQLEVGSVPRDVGDRTAGPA